MNLRRSVSLAIVLLGASSLAMAQTRMYSPATLAHHEAMTSTGYPTGYASFTKMTYQQVHGDLPARPLPIRFLAFRPRATSPSYSGYTVTLTMHLGLGGPTPDAATSTYLTNLGPTPVKVLDNANVNLASFTQAGVPPAPYAQSFPFPAPFLYDGKGVLCWEMRVHNHTYTGGTMNFDLYQTQTALSFRIGGVGCTASGKPSPATMIATYSAGTVSANCANLNDNLPVLLLIGLSSTSWGAFPLPLDLTPLGVPCALRTDILLVLPNVVANGGAIWPIPVPATAPSGTAFYMQALHVDPKANKQGWVLSNSLAVLWPYTVRPVIRNWTTSNDMATTGSFQNTYGLVTELGL